MRLRGRDCYECVLTRRSRHPLGRVACPYSRQSAVRSRRQQVIPEPKPSSWGRNSQRIPVYSTIRIPHSTLRLSRRLRPGRRGLRGTTGSSGSIRAHNSSSISHGLARSSSSRLARTPFGQHQRELTCRHFRRSRNLLLLGVVRGRADRRGGEPRRETGTGWVITELPRSVINRGLPRKDWLRLAEKVQRIWGLLRSPVQPSGSELRRR